MSTYFRRAIISAQVYSAPKKKENTKHIECRSGRRKVKRVKKMKKTKIEILMGVVASMLVFGTATEALAAGTGLEDAKRTALETVGVTEDQVIFKKAAQDLDDGRKIYEIDFFVPHEVKYEFDIDANTGRILDQDMDLWEADDDMEYADLMKNTGKSTTKAAGEISELQAKTIAVKDAGLAMNAVTFTKCKRDFDDGMEQYEIEFRTADFCEYDYDISVKNGRIISRDFDYADFDD